MSKFDTAACLRARHGAVGVIKNIRRVRSLLRSKPFDGALFDKINGSDGALESLVGRNVLFAVLDDAERHQLKHDINVALTDQETKAYSALRTTMVDFFKRIKDAVRDCAPVDADVLKRLELKSAEALNAFDEQKTSAGALSLERCVSTLEEMELVADQLEQDIPAFKMFLDEEDDDGLNEEANKDETHEEKNGETTEDNNEGAASEGESTGGDDDDDLDLPDETEEEDEDDDDDDDKNEEGESTDEEWVEDLYEFKASAEKFIKTEESTLRDLEATPERAKAMLVKRAEVVGRLNKALQDFIDIVEPETCVEDTMLKGSTKLFKKIDKVIEAVESLEPLRNAMDITCNAIVAAARPMFIAATSKR